MKQPEESCQVCGRKLIGSELVEGTIETIADRIPHKPLTYVVFYEPRKRFWFCHGCHAIHIYAGKQLKLFILSDNQKVTFPFQSHHEPLIGKMWKRIFKD